jgi:hypothetical protein
MTAAPVGAAVMAPLVPRCELFVVLALPSIDVIASPAAAIAVVVVAVIPAIDAAAATKKISDHLRFLS